MDVDAYLARIGLSPAVETDLANLERLQRAHLTAVPFENLDVFARRDVGTDDRWSVAKVVERRRGGWCFELNGAFAALLTALGYQVKRLAATVLPEDGSPMPTHLTLEVTLDRPYLVDVGFGDSFIRPLPLDREGPHDGGNGAYGFVFEDGLTTLFSFDGNERTPQFRFDRSPRTAADFEAASKYLQTEPGLQWTESRFATRLLDGGPDRVSLVPNRLRLRRDGVWSEQPVSDSRWDDLLDEWFELTP
jgi:N-hydroxyarylamine O-acetyltransferase